MTNVKMLSMLVLLFILSSCISGEKSFFKRKYLNLERIKEVEKNAVRFQLCTGNNDLINCQSVSTDSVGVNDRVVLQDQEKSTYGSIVPELTVDTVNSLNNKNMFRCGTEKLYNLQEKSLALNHQQPLDSEIEKTDAKRSLKLQSVWFVIGLLLMIATFWLTSLFGLAFFWALGSLALIASIISLIWAVRYLAGLKKGTKTGIDAVFSFLMLAGSLLVSGFLVFFGTLILIVNFG